MPGTGLRSLDMTVNKAKIPVFMDPTFSHEKPNAAKKKKKRNLSSILQDDGLENPLDRGAWGSTVYGVAESQA